MMRSSICAFLRIIAEMEASIIFSKLWKNCNLEDDVECVLGDTALLRGLEIGGLSDFVDFIRDTNHAMLFPKLWNQLQDALTGDLVESIDWRISLLPLDYPSDAFLYNQPRRKRHMIERSEQ